MNEVCEVEVDGYVWRQRLEGLSTFRQSEEDSSCMLARRGTRTCRAGPGMSEMSQRREEPQRLSGRAAYDAYHRG